MTDYSHLIIETPGLQNLKQRFGHSMFTLAFWLFWFYLWQPVISIVAWAFGVRFFHENMIGLGGLQGFLSLLGGYALVVGSIALIFFGWAAYNNFRFRHRSRRESLWKISLHNIQ